MLLLNDDITQILIFFWQETVFNIHKAFDKRKHQRCFKIISEYTAIYNLISMPFRRNSYDSYISQNICRIYHSFNLVNSIINKFSERLMHKHTE